MEDPVLAVHNSLGNLYKYMEIKQDASKKDIKKAYKRLALLFHPDKNQALGATDKFKNVKKTYDILSHDINKAFYDRFLK